MDVPHPEPAPAGLSRRSLVKRGLLGGALLAAGGAGFLALRSGATVALPGDGLLVFTPAQFAVLDAVARRMVRPRQGWPGVDQVGVARAAIASPRAWSPSAQKELQAAARPVRERARRVHLRRPHPALHPAGWRRAGRGARRSGATAEIAVRRTGYAALRTLVLAGYYQSPAVWPSVGYGGPPRIFDDGPSLPEWCGGDEPRPDGNGVWHGEPLK